MLAIAILAAGKGTRMKSKHPKVLQILGGKPLIKRVYSVSQKLNPERTLVIVGHDAEKVMESLSDEEGIEYVHQKEQKGTGHAIQQLLDPLKSFEGDLLVLNGDVPLLEIKTLEELISLKKETKSSASFISAQLKDPSGYGRVIKGPNKSAIAIKEERDCNQEEQQIDLINCGVYCFDWQSLRQSLDQITSNNAQNEIYLTDAISLLNNCTHYKVADSTQIQGVNDRLDLNKCESIIQEKVKTKLMKAGVSFIDLNSCSISEEAEFGIDVTIEPQTHIKGSSKIGNDCSLGPNTLIEDSILNDNVNVSMSVVRNSTIESGVNIGPFSNIRPESKIDRNCCIGNFVEIKKSKISEGTKVNHLSYIGDAVIGNGVNIGAGTITANYDGKRKHLTEIGDFTKTGANSVLVAPIIIGANVTIGAGSTLTKDVPNGSLALARAKQFIKSGWFTAN